MTEETLEKAKHLSHEIKRWEKNLKAFSWGIHENVEPRSLEVKLQRDVIGEVPKELFRTLSQVCYNQIKVKIEDLKAEFKQL